MDVFVGKAPVRPSLDVGLFEVYQRAHSGTGPPTEAMIATLRLHAALRGCDAVQILGVELVGKTREPVVEGVCGVHRRPGASGGEPDRCSEAAVG